MIDKNTQLKPATSLKLKSLKDLVKLIASTLSERSATGYIGHYVLTNTDKTKSQKHIYFMFNSSLGYYELRSLPIVIWVETENAITGSFIRYRASPKEEMEFVNEVGDAKWPVSIPIVNFEEMPEFLRIWE